VRTLTRRSLLIGAAAAPLAAQAQTPGTVAPGTTKMVVPYPPGGSTDVIARLVQPELQQRLGATIIMRAHRAPSALRRWRSRRLTAPPG